MDFNVSNNTAFCQFFSLIFSLDAISLSLAIRQRLLLAVHRGTNRATVDDYVRRNFLYRLKHQSPVVYRCTIAFQLQKQCNLPPMKLAVELASLLSSTMLQNKSPNKPEIDVTVKVVEPGWLDFVICDRTLAAWLDNLTESFANIACSQEKSQSQMDFNPFPLQYAHARCCSLLRLAAEQNLIKLKSEDFGQTVWQWLEPRKIPWLTQTKQLQLVHPKEKFLLCQLIDIIDLLSGNSPENWYQLTRELSKALLDFEASCRIFGEVKNENPSLAQARLGLIGLTQLLLQKLLTEFLGVDG
jgi:arginyl-tRNA synthetase